MEYANNQTIVVKDSVITCDERGVRVVFCGVVVYKNPSNGGAAWRAAKHAAMSLCPYDIKNMPSRDIVSIATM